MVHSQNAEQVSKRIGQILRRIRRQRGLSLEALATEVDVSKLTLGQIERGEGNPTLAVIWKIARGLNVPVSSLVAEEHEVSVSKAGNSLSLWSSNQAFRVEPVFNASTEQMFEVYRATIQPRASYESEPHPNGVVEMLTVMSGKAQIKVGEDVYTLDPFDAIRFHANCTHTYQNKGTESAVLHMIISYQYPTNAGTILFDQPSHFAEQGKSGENKQ